MFETDLRDTREPALSDAESDICFEIQPAHVGAHLTLLTIYARPYATFPLRCTLLSTFKPESKIWHGLYRTEYVIPPISFGAFHFFINATLASSVSSLIPVICSDSPSYSFAPLILS